MYELLTCFITSVYFLTYLFKTNFKVEVINKKVTLYMLLLELY